MLPDDVKELGAGGVGLLEPSRLQLSISRRVTMKELLVNSKKMNIIEGSPRQLEDQNVTQVQSQSGVLKSTGNKAFASK